MYHLGRQHPREAGRVDRRDGPAGARPDLGLPDDGSSRPSRSRRRCSPRSTAATRDGKPLSAYTELKDDGSTACGCWIYCGVYADGVNQAARRKPGKEQNWVAPEWGWAWPANRRILYNRASADPDGKPWSERKALVWWDEEQAKWTGHDVAGLRRRQVARTTGRRQDATGAGGAVGHRPVHHAGRRQGVAVRAGRPHRRAAARALRAAGVAVRQPALRAAAQPGAAGACRSCTRTTGSSRATAQPGADVFPFVATTYRLTEHHTAGGMSRWLPYLAELQPEFFCEVSPELAAERGLEHLGWATIVTARNAIEARVLVTERITPLTVQGRTMHQVGLPYHWGRTGW